MSFVSSVVHALEGLGQTQINVWCGKGIRQASDIQLGHAHVRPYFVRKLRRLQSICLYAKLMRQPGRVLICTASSADFFILDLIGRFARLPAKQFFLFVHWINPSASKLKMYSQIANRQPGLVILAPTDAVFDFFSQCGFSVRRVPYPVESVTPSGVEPVAVFRHLLVPGSARTDKGFQHVVAMLEQMHASKRQLPTHVQTTVEHGHDRDMELNKSLQRLSTLQTESTSWLKVQSTPLDAQSYGHQFSGSVVIQPYDAASFKDRVSGVTLDALGRGAPVIVTDHTWMANLVKATGAGVVIERTDATSLMKAVETVVQNYSQYSRLALDAAKLIDAQHSATALAIAITEQ